MNEEVQWIKRYGQRVRSETATHTQRETVLRLLRKRFPEQSPDDLRPRLEAETSPDVLNRWLELVVDVPSLDAFRAALDG